MLLVSLVDKFFQSLNIRNTIINFSICSMSQPCAISHNLRPCQIIALTWLLLCYEKEFSANS